MKKLIFTLAILSAFAFDGYAQTLGGTQVKFDGTNLMFRMPRYNGNYTTTWFGWAHYWGTTTGNGIKMHIHASDPRMSSATNKLVFMDSDRVLWMDLHCRTMYQTSDERLKQIFSH